MIAEMLPGCQEMARIRGRMSRRKASVKKRQDMPVNRVGAEQRLRQLEEEADAFQARMRAAAKAYARELSERQGLKVRELFSDALEGDLARRSVLRRLRREHPAVPYGMLDFIVEEELSP